MQEGIIVKGIAGFYYVEIEGGSIIECKARGKFRKDKVIPIVGDKVEVSDIKNNKGVIDEILPRKSQLIRPLVANVDQAFIVFALKKPDINMNLLDKLLVIAEHHNLRTIICLNKSDLDCDDEFERIGKIYKDIGYEVIKTNGLSGEGMDLLREYARKRISVFVGPSGVGKSTIFNRIQSKVVMETGEISNKVDRGKHTTRHAELIEIGKDSFIVDTPGFSSMDINFIKPGELQYAFRDFNEYLCQCKFTSCLHHKEKECEIKQAVEEGKISRDRYNSYINLLIELQQNYRGY